MAGRKPANGPRHKHGFVRIDYVRCPDCEANGALRNDGGAIVVSGGQLRGSSEDVGVTTRASGCPTCKGKGAIRTDDLEALMKAGIELPTIADLDPYAIPPRPRPSHRNL
jgi:DnaJ-class molecular chaperone